MSTSTRHWASINVVVCSGSPIGRVVLGIVVDDNKGHS
jgi:hypothetical protein